MKTERINQEKIVILEKTQNHLGEADSIKALEINFCPTIVFFMVDSVLQLFAFLSSKPGIQG